MAEALRQACARNPSMNTSSPTTSRTPSLPAALSHFGVSGMGGEGLAKEFDRTLHEPFVAAQPPKLAIVGQPAAYLVQHGSKDSEIAKALARTLMPLYAALSQGGAESLYRNGNSTRIDLPAAGRAPFVLVQPEVYANMQSAPGKQLQLDRRGQRWSEGYGSAICLTRPAANRIMVRLQRTVVFCLMTLEGAGRHVAVGESRVRRMADCPNLRSIRVAACFSDSAETGCRLNSYWVALKRTQPEDAGSSR